MHLTKRQALGIMKKLEIDFKECRHHYRGILKLDGVEVLVIHCSHGEGEVPGHVPHRFRKNLMISVREFEALRDCPMSREAYLDLLRDRLREPAV